MSKMESIFMSNSKISNSLKFIKRALFYVTFRVVFRYKYWKIYYVCIIKKGAKLTNEGNNIRYSVSH